ncbi:MAG TPA: hypothetical protein VFQ25_12080 [Ktedonobacterales bacterium]|nr:hypothetical protein [Ktedonobacterales bacterium]
MKWFWQRRKKDMATPGSTLVEEPPRRIARTTAPPRITTPPRAGVRSTPLGAAMEPRDALLAFARDLLNARGARVRVEEDDLITATLSDGSSVRYTTTLARASAEEETTLLTQGAPALDLLFEEAARQARISAAVLARGDDPAALAMRSLTPPIEACGRCAGGGSEGWQAGAATCDACPLRHDAPALRWESRPVAARVIRWKDEPSIELTYRVTGRDRRGRRDEWLRVALNMRTGRRMASLTLDQLAAAQPVSPASTPPDTSGAAAVERAREALRPGMEALSAYLSQRVEVEFQRQVEDVTAAHERLKRERPDEASTISSSLDRELSSLGDVYGIEVEASLEAVCYITSPVALVAIETERGASLAVSVDAGWGIVYPPTCAGCGSATAAGRVCAHGHVYCSDCAAACAHCGAMRCAGCDEQPLAPCGLCRDLVCSACSRVCDACSGYFCSTHVWACVEGDQTLCLSDLALCDECQAPLCQTHASLCSACGEPLCPRHARVCKTGGETLCAAHAASCVTCSQPVCAAHVIRCEECAEAVCGDDIFACLGCGRALCACASLAPCASCAASYCGRCRDDEDRCPACRVLVPAGEAELALLRLASEHEPTISLKRAWLTGRNMLTQVYVSRGLGREEAYLISEDGKIIASYRKGWRA